MCQPGSTHFLEEINEQAQLLQALKLSETPASGTPPQASAIEQAVSKEAKLKEAEGLLDLSLFRLYLQMESGQSIAHPWLLQLHQVLHGELDPRELLKVYLEDPDSLTLTNRKDPKQAWRPPTLPCSLRCKPEALKYFSKADAVRALVLNKSWKSSPKLRKVLKDNLGRDVI